MPISFDKQSYSLSSGSDIGIEDCLISEFFKGYDTSLIMSQLNDLLVLPDSGRVLKSNRIKSRNH